MKYIISAHLHTDGGAHECRAEREIADHEGQAKARAGSASTDEQQQIMV